MRERVLVELRKPKRTTADKRLARSRTPLKVGALDPNVGDVALDDVDKEKSQLRGLGGNDGAR